jgi:ribonuclease VapC
MVVDSSALLAILQDEPERRAFLEALDRADTRRMSVANFVEVSMVVDARQGPAGILDLDRFLSKASFELVPVDVAQAHLAREAFSRFGRGRHRASLNLGDCFAYALARALGEQLLCKGDDFVYTDLRVVRS